MRRIEDDNELSQVHSRGTGLVYNDRSGTHRGGDRYNVLHAAWCSCIPRSNTRIPKYYFDSLPDAIQWLSTNRGPENKNWKRCGICGARPQEDSKPAIKEMALKPLTRSRRPPASYLDFDVEVEPGTGREYPVVVRSPAGEARETMAFPFDELALRANLLELQNALLRSGGPRRRSLSAEERAVQSFGRALFDALMAGEVRSRYDTSQERAANQDKGLRLRLRFLAPDLAALPWEYLYDSRHDRYLCLYRSTPLVRYLELPQTIRPIAVTPPLRILGVVASPKDLPSLDEPNEQRRVEEALRGLRADGRVELEWLPGQTWQDLQRALRWGPWHVLHFVGHGRYSESIDQGVVYLTGDGGYARELQAGQFGQLLANHSSLRLVVMNSCEGARAGTRDIFSSTSNILVRRGIPAVIAMQHEITDRAAVELSRAFYETLADGEPVDAALTEARVAVSLAVPNTVEWGTPVLTMRAPDGVLFDLATNPAPAHG